MPRDCWMPSLVKGRVLAKRWRHRNEPDVRTAHRGPEGPWEAGGSVATSTEEGGRGPCTRIPGSYSWAGTRRRRTGEGRARRGQKEAEGAKQCVCKLWDDRHAGARWWGEGKVPAGQDPAIAETSEGRRAPQGNSGRTEIKAGCRLPAATGQGRELLSHQRGISPEQEGRQSADMKDRAVRTGSREREKQFSPTLVCRAERRTHLMVQVKSEGGFLRGLRTDLSTWTFAVWTGRERKESSIWLPGCRGSRPQDWPRKRAF